MIIALEGIDNAGKTTIASRLEKYYKAKGIEVVISKELTTDVGQCLINKIKNDYVSSEVKTFLFAADRQIRIENLAYILNIKDSIVIFDRYLYSAVAYRGSEGISDEWVLSVNRFVKEADLNIYIDITPEESISRNNNVKFNIHYSYEELEKVRYKYLQFVDSGKMKMVDGMRDIEQVSSDIIKLIDEFLIKARS